VAVASAGPYASQHLAPVRKPCQYPTTQFFYGAGCPSCRPTNIVKALKAGDRESVQRKRIKAQIAKDLVTLALCFVNSVSK